MPTFILFSAWTPVDQDLEGQTVARQISVRGVNPLDRVRSASFKLKDRARQHADTLISDLVLGEDTLTLISPHHDKTPKARSTPGVPLPQQFQLATDHTFTGSYGLMNDDGIWRRTIDDSKHMH
ncbi:hypothetical protein EDB85DRAFT_1894632 [Lactarius pseudohatsudake]|nr:hypothetical protein EDB85DRAFT_1894632 [Lactarius pseudohatsudake]